jgi:hypothetical protein
MKKTQIGIAMCLSQAKPLTFMREEESEEILLQLPTPRVYDALHAGSTTKTAVVQKTS